MSVRVLWTCPAYKDGREKLTIKFRATLKDCEALDSILYCELWMENFDSTLALVKEYITDVWEVRKVKLYGEPCSTQPQSQSSAGYPRDGGWGAEKR